MYKLTQNVAKIDDKLEVNVTMFIQNDDAFASSLNPKFITHKTMSKFDLEGSTYIKFNPSPFLDIVIDPYSKEYIAYKHIRCNKMDIFTLIKGLDKVIKHFTSKVDLFYYYNDKLNLNENIKNDIIEIIKLRERVLKLEPSIIIDSNNIQHEGITMYVNSPSVYVLLTFSEMEFLSYILKTTDIDNICSNLYLMNFSNKVKEVKTVINNNSYNINDIEQLQNDSTISYATPKNGNTIPNI